jgi:hypothetical protein
MVPSESVLTNQPKRDQDVSLAQAVGDLLGTPPQPTRSPARSLASYERLMVNPCTDSRSLEPVTYLVTTIPEPLIWRCWQDHAPYDPAAHNRLQTILKQRQPIAA